MNKHSLADNPIDHTAKSEWVGEHVLGFLYQNATPSALGSLAVVCLLSWVIHNPGNFDFLVPWIFTCFVIALLRAVLVYRFRAREKDRKNPFWLNSFRLVNGISGIVIGSMVWLYIPFANTADKVLILCAIVGLVAGATPSYSVDTRSFLSFVLPSCLLPIAFYAWNTPDGYGPIIGMFVLYIIVMIRVAFQSRESLIKNFELTYTLNYRATHDALSGLLNRQELENQFLIATPKSQHGIAMLFLDLDNFKLLNDSLGHHSGDEALRQLAEIMHSCVREDDICARLGGDEFIVLLYLDDPSIAENIAHAIITAVNNLTFDDPNFSGLGCSIGIAFKANNAVSYSTIMKEADKACYASKNSGKNQQTYRSIA
jgi:diguanylate cyclase (GGDEF)-like protein